MSDTTYLGDPGTTLPDGSPVNIDTQTVSIPALGPGGCYPSDFIGPLPTGGQYCNAPNTPTAFGAINSILQQASTTAANIRNTINTYAGKTVKPVVVTVAPSQTSPVGLLVLALALGLVVWLIVKAKRR